MRQSNNAQDLASAYSPKLQASLKIAPQEKRNKIANESAKNPQNKLPQNEQKDRMNIQKKRSDVIQPKRENLIKNANMSSSDLQKELVKHAIQSLQSSLKSIEQFQSWLYFERIGKFWTLNSFQTHGEPQKQKIAMNLDIKNILKVDQDQISNRTKTAELDKKKHPQSATLLKKKSDQSYSSKASTSTMDSHARVHRNQETQDTNSPSTFGKTANGAFYQLQNQPLDKEERSSSLQKQMASSTGASGFQFLGKNTNKAAITKKLFDSTQHHNSNDSRFIQQTLQYQQGSSFLANSNNVSYNNLGAEYFRKNVKKQSQPFSENSPKQSNELTSFYDSKYYDQPSKEKTPQEKEADEEYQIERKDKNGETKSKSNLKNWQNERKQMTSAPYKLCLNHNDKVNLSKSISGNELTIRQSESKKPEEMNLKQNNSQISPNKKVKSSTTIAKKEVRQKPNNTFQTENNQKKVIHQISSAVDNIIKNDKFTSTGTNFRKQNSIRKDNYDLKGSPSSINMIKAKQCSNNNNNLQPNPNKANENMQHCQNGGGTKQKAGVMTLFAQKILPQKITQRIFKSNEEQNNIQASKVNYSNVTISPQSNKIANISSQNVTLSPQVQSELINLHDHSCQKSQPILSDFVTQEKQNQILQQQLANPPLQNQQNIINQSQIEGIKKQSSNQFRSQQKEDQQPPDSSLKISDLSIPLQQQEKRERTYTPVAGEFCYYNTWMFFHNSYPNSAEEMCKSFCDHFYSTFNSLNYCKSLQPIDPIHLEMKSIELPQIPRKEKTIIFDLDETLVHYNEDPSIKSDVIIPVNMPNGDQVQAGINIRPYARECLKELSKYFEIIILTASHSCYADKVVDLLDPENKYVDFRFNRESCIVSNEGVHIKDLRIFKNRELSKMVIVDNAAYSFCFQLENGIPIIPFYDNIRDMELKFLTDFIKQLLPLEDVRVYLKKTFKFQLYVESQSVEEALQKVYNIFPSQNPITLEELQDEYQSYEFEETHQPQSNRQIFNSEEIQIGENRNQGDGNDDDDDDLDLERYQSFEENNEDTQESLQQ